MIQNLQISIVAALLALPGALPGAESSAPPTPGVQEQIAAAAREELEAAGIPSLQIAIARGDEILFEGAFGLADVENAVPATPATRYRIASVSKWLTATATLSLAADGVLDLDQPVQTYCPEFPGKAWPVTARHLLTHTSGIRHYRDFEAELEAAATPEERSKIELARLRSELSSVTHYTDVCESLATFADDPLEFEPGTDWAYTSFGYRLLGCVLQGAAGRSYASVLRERVLDPAGMDHTVEDDAWAIIPGRAEGYRLERGAGLRRADLRDVSENLPAGGHLSTATDLVHFVLALNAGRLIPAEWRALMFRDLQGNVVAPTGDPSWRDAIPSKGKYGLGQMFFPHGTETWYGHTGRQAGGSAIVAVDPRADVVVAVLTNVKGWNGYLSFTGELMRIVAGAGESE